jgi:hypothetical protein
MIDVVKQVIANQFEAGFATINRCVQQATDDLWHQPVARYPFCQVAFHTLFFADYYLGPDAEAFSLQPFHLANKHLFGDYEQLEDREPTSRYEKPQIITYLDFCRAKASATIAGETEATLSARAKFDGKDFSRAELHVYNIRHIQHHAAQMILRLRLHSVTDIPWYRSGWG